MKKFLDLVNLPKHIRNYIVNQKIESQLNHNHSMVWVFVIDITILVLFLAVFYYIFFINRDPSIKKAGLIGCGLFVIFILFKLSASSSKYERRYEGIKTLILKDDDGRNVKSWDLENQTALLIGKNASGNYVDIDLSDAQFASMVSKQHAVLNFSNNAWYVEDLGSTNGTGLKRVKDKKRFKLEQGKPYKLDIGDLIYIANIQILVK